MHTLLEMVINAPVGSYINAIQRQPLVNKFVEIHNQVQQGARIDVLSAAEASAVDVMRFTKAAQNALPLTGNAGPAAHAEGVVAPQPQLAVK
jgi:hypothetical protein